jgi:hypothetical protein
MANTSPYRRITVSAYFQLEVVHRDIRGKVQSWVVCCLLVRVVPVSLGTMAAGFSDVIFTGNRLLVFVNFVRARAPLVKGAILS